MSDLLVIVFTMVLFLLALVVVPNFLVHRAAKKVVRIFRKYDALGPDRAKDIETLGLKPPTFAQRMMRLRDYKPRALDVLINAGVVQRTEDGRLYLSEARLNDTRLGQNLKG